MKKVVIFIIGFIVFTISNAQSPWTKSKGGGFVQASYTTIPRYSILYNNGTDNFYTSRRIKDDTYQLYGEYGVTDKLTALVVLPFKVTNAGKVSDSTTLPVFDSTLISEGTLAGLGNISVAVRYKLPTNKFNSAFQLKVELPNHSVDEKRGLATGYNTLTILPMLSAGKGFDENNYFFGYAGYGYRTNNYSHIVNFGGEGGHRFFNQFWAILFVDVLASLKNGDEIVKLHTYNQMQTGLYVNNQEYLAWGLKFIEELNENIGLTAGLGGAFSGHMVAKSPALSIGAYYKW